jgi:uncharacterized membrane protein YfcA
VKQPIETKVTAATIAAAATTFALWLLSTYVFAGDVPAPVAGLVAVAVPGAVTFAAGYSARHTHRPGATHPARRRALKFSPTPPKED